MNRTSISHPDHGSAPWRTPRIANRLGSVIGLVGIWISVVHYSVDGRLHLVTSAIALLGVAAAMSFLEAVRQGFGSAAHLSDELESHLLVIAEDHGRTLSVPEAAGYLLDARAHAGRAAIERALSSLERANHCYKDCDSNGQMRWYFGAESESKQWITPHVHDAGRSTGE